MSTEIKKDIIFNLNAYKNNPNYYIHPNSKPDKLEDYLY